jgi:geranylgeranyl pyrophosphate synthase
MIQGIYEELVTQLVKKKIEELGNEKYYIKKNSIDKEEASIILAQHISKTVKHALTLIKGENAIESQINIANKIVKLLKEELNNIEFEDDL